MRRPILRAAWVFGLLAAPSVTTAQKTILLSDTLVVHADKLKVNDPTQWAGRIAGWRFGDYAVAMSKQGPVETTTSQLFLKADSSTGEKFSFVLTNNTTDSALVDAARNSTVKMLKSLRLPLGKGWFLGTDEAVSESDNFAAFITINRDTTDTWAFFLGLTGSSNSGFLSNGERRITVALASSNRNASDLSGWPAIGYEFLEDGRSIGAIQFFGGSAHGGRFVWLNRNLDARTKLLLAAAMTAVLQMNRL